MFTRSSSGRVQQLNGMDGSKARPTPCSICGLAELHGSDWFLVVENCWFDRLRIFRWDPSLAVQPGCKSVCCREHLKALIAFWLHRSNLRFFLEEVPIAGASGCANRNTWDAAPRENWQLLGEISVYRESFSREWSGSPEALEAMVEAMIPGNGEKPQTLRFQHLPRMQESRFGLCSP